MAANFCIEVAAYYEFSVVGSFVDYVVNVFEESLNFLFVLLWDVMGDVYVENV